MKRLKFYSLFSFTLLALSTYASKDEKIKIEDLIFNVDDNVASVAGLGLTYEEAITIPSEIEFNGQTFPVISIGENAFANSTVKELTVPSSIKSIGEGAFKSTHIEKLYIESIKAWCDIDFAYDRDFLGNDFIAESSANPIANTTEIFVDGVRLIQLDIPEGMEKIKNFTFSGLKIDKVNFPSSLKEIGNGSFKGLDTEEITFPYNIESIGIQSFENSTIKSMTIEEGANVTIEDDAFYDCYDLSDVYFYGSANLSEEVFSGCRLNVHLYSKVDAVWNAFYGGIIKSVEVPSIEIWAQSFISDCEVINYAYILLVDGEEPKALNIPFIEGLDRAYSLSGIDSVTEASFDEGIENIFLVQIMPGLKFLSLPSSLNFINGIIVCPQLTDIEVKATMPPRNEFYSGGLNHFRMADLFENCTLHVPDYAVEAYREDAGWGNFKNIQGEAFGGIGEIIDNENNRTVIIYDLSGRRVNPDNLTPGMYIVNGKKVVL